MATQPQGHPAASRFIDRVLLFVRRSLWLLAKIFAVLACSIVVRVYFMEPAQRVGLRHFTMATWGISLSVLSQTNLSAILYTVVPPIAVFILTLIWERQNRPGGDAMRQLKESSVAAAIGLAVPILIMVAVYGWKFVSGIYDDHHNITSRWSQVVKEKDDLKEELRKRDAYIKRLEEKTASISSPSKPSQRSLEEAPSPLAIVHIAYQKPIASADPDMRYGLEALVTTDKEITPMALNFVFSGEIGKFFASVPFGPFQEQQGGIRVTNPSVAIIQRQSPGFTPDVPIKITVYSKSSIRLKKVESVPFNFPLPAGELK